MPSFFGTMKMKTTLTARLFEPIDKSLSIDFLREHPVTTHPHLYKAVKGGKRVVKDRLVTDAFAVFVAAQLITETSVFGDFKYHQTGTGTTAENAADTDMETPAGTLARDVGTQVQGAGGTKTYKSVATTTYASSLAITEHGLFNDAGSGSPPTGPTLIDRSVFSALNVVENNQIEWTYELTVAAGG